jgi:plastocyanin
MRRVAPHAIAGLVLLLTANGPHAAALPRPAMAMANQFVPPTIEIRTGDSLTFFNTDPFSGVVGHTLTHLSPKPRFDSGLLAAGAMGEVKGVPDLAAGTYDFFCTVHPFMTGKLVVNGA